MEIVVTGRHTQVKQKFRDVVESKMNRVTAIAPDAQRAQIVLTHEGNPRQADTAKRVEITVIAGHKGLAFTGLHFGDTPIVIRRKLHIAEPMSIDEALYEMELIGHDFFLFVNKETGRPSVVYHRHGWSYGVFEIDTPENIKNK